MTIAILFGVVVLLGFGFFLLDRSKEQNSKRSHRHWQPDVDQEKAETMKNLETPPDRQDTLFQLPETPCSNFSQLFP
ncbi:MAG: hypothetical protein K5905_05385 [Roseibium sp.]|uniref:hypothetical protein n=1 Tax=Roseibium sp. TaxID=1936156 RepID=UPI0026038BE7|nr:hypothetical protein [Roseibium sp.]MCV0424880.1 hypothetical protein [Roseibium sp.]